MTWTKPRPADRVKPDDGSVTPVEMAKAFANVALAKQAKALDLYGEAMHDDPTSREAAHAFEYWLTTMRALHEANIGVYRAMRATWRRSVTQAEHGVPNVGTVDAVHVVPHGSVTEAPEALR